MTFSAFAQNTLSENNFRAYDGNGNPVEFSKIIDALENADVVFLGENHDDPTAHALQLEIFKRAFEKYGQSRSIVLSMEMFERDVQSIVDEYLQDLINENNFISSSRAWNNYKTDYKPLVEFAKANKLPVVAANAPRRYVNRVSRLGRDSLNVLSPEAKSLLAPLPYNQASKDYAEKFNKLMGMAGHEPTKILDSQSLWDATMGYSISQVFKKHKNALVVNLNGSFHSENRWGTPEHLMKYRPKTRFLVVTMRSDESFPNFAKDKHQNLGDFVIITDPKLPRTFKSN